MDTEEKRKIFKVLGKTGTMNILEQINDKKVARYQDLMKIFEGEATFVRRIRELSDLGLIERRVTDEKYRPTEYALTKKGKKVLELID